MKKANDLGRHLVALRHRSKLSQNDLATKIQLAGADISRQDIANWESGRRAINTDQVKALMRALNCTLDELFFGVAPAKPSRPVRK